jgi:transcriptional regulator with PAS, ATPase and Fis domain
LFRLVKEIRAVTGNTDVEVQTMSAVTRLGFDDIIGCSHSLQHIIRLLKRIANTPLNTILFLGETGTGKDLLARVLHDESPRACHPFVEVNCMAVPETLLEGELFGHEAGAYTDAKQSREGLVCTANRGTLFLNEIADISIGMQVKLLRLIEDRTYRKLGSVQELHSDLRIIAATSGDLESLVRSRQFKMDLYYRLNVFPIHIPPLRERVEDTLPLAHHFLHHYAAMYGKQLDTFSPQTEELLRKYPWPGNVRELRNVIEHLVMLQEDDGVVGPQHLPVQVRKLRPLNLTNQSGNGLSEVFETLILQNLSLDEIEQTTIEMTLQETAGNVSRAARRLKIGRSSLISRMKKYGITPKPAPRASTPQSNGSEEP